MIAVQAVPTAHHHYKRRVLVVSSTGHEFYVRNSGHCLQHSRHFVFPVEVGDSFELGFPTFVIGVLRVVEP